METPLVIPGFVVISVFWRVVRGIGVIDYGRRRPTSFFFKLTQEIGKNPAKSRIVKSGQGGGVWRPIFSAPHRVPTVQKKCSKVSISLRKWTIFL